MGTGSSVGPVSDQGETPGSLPRSATHHPKRSTMEVQEAQLSSEQLGGPRAEALQRGPLPQLSSHRSRTKGELLMSVTGCSGMDHSLPVQPALPAHASLV